MRSQLRRNAWCHGLLAGLLAWGGMVAPARAQVIQASPLSTSTLRVTQVCGPRLGCVKAVLLSGDIPPSPHYVQDFDRFARRPAAASIRWVALDSPGGSLRPALMLARHLRAKGYNTMIAPGAECNSACVYLFAGGVHRWVLPGGRLGIHAYEVKPNGPDDHADFAQWVVREVAVTMRDFGVRPEWLMAMLSTPNEHVCYVQPVCARELNLDNSRGLHRGAIRAACSAGAPTWLAPDHNEPIQPPPLCAPVSEPLPSTVPPPQ